MKKLIPIILIVTLTGCHSINQRLGLQDDNPIEQSIEDKIHDATGCDIDLTPENRR